MVFKEKLNQKEISVLASQYKESMEKAGYPITKLVLFGSYARGAQHDWSDVDFVVVSSEYNKKNSFDELVEANIIAARVSPMIEAHPATPEEYENGDNPWLAEAKKYGKVVA